MSVEFTPVGAEFVTTEYLCISSDNFKMTRQTSMTDEVISKVFNFWG